MGAPSFRHKEPPLLLQMEGEESGGKGGAGYMHASAVEFLRGMGSSPEFFVMDE